MKISSSSSTKVMNTLTQHLLQSNNTVHIILKWVLEVYFSANNNNNNFNTTLYRIPIYCRVTTFTDVKELSSSSASNYLKFAHEMRVRRLNSRLLAGCRSLIIWPQGGSIIQLWSPWCKFRVLSGVYDTSDSLMTQKYHAVLKHWRPQLRATLLPLRTKVPAPQMVLTVAHAALLESPVRTTKRGCPPEDCSYSVWRVAVITLMQKNQRTKVNNELI